MPNPGDRRARVPWFPPLLVGAALLGCGGAGCDAGEASRDEAPAAPTPTGSVLEVTDYVPVVCAIAGGRVRCVGRRFFEELSGGELPARGVHEIELPGPAVALASGGAHVCALTADGEVYCFGDGEHQQLARKDLDGSARAQRIPIDGRVTAISADGLHTGAVMCWGSPPPPRGPYLPEPPRLPDGTPLTGVTGLRQMVALHPAGAHTLQPPSCGDERWSRRQARRVAGSEAPVVGGGTDACHRCLVRSTGTLSCTPAAGEEASLALGFVPRGLRCALGRCCGLEADELRCWSLRGGRVEALSLRTAVRTDHFEMGSGTFCYLEPADGSGCRPVACVGHGLGGPAPAAAVRADPALYGRRPGHLSLCATP